MKKNIAICPMAQMAGCLLQRCVFYDTFDGLCMMNRQHLAILETNITSGILVLLSLEKCGGAGFLPDGYAFEKLSDVAQAIALYTSHLKRVLSSGIPRKERDRLMKKLDELKVVLNELNE